jgi:hypothetical protein
VVLLHSMSMFVCCCSGRLLRHVSPLGLRRVRSRMCCNCTTITARGETLVALSSDRCPRSIGALSTLSLISSQSLSDRSQRDCQHTLCVCVMRCIGCMSRQSLFSKSTLACASRRIHYVPYIKFVDTRSGTTSGTYQSMLRRALLWLGQRMLTLW